MLGFQRKSFNLWKVRNNPCHLFRCEKICRKIKHLQVWELLHKRQIVVRNRAPGKRELFHACVCKRHHTMNLTEPLKYGILKAADDLHDAGKAIDNATDVIDGAIDTYKNLRKVNKGTGKEVHHIVEKRLAKYIDVNLNTDDMLSIALDHDTHKGFTKAWREILPYGKSHNWTVDDIWSAAQDIYRDCPELLEAARKNIWG